MRWGFGEGERRPGFPDLCGLVEGGALLPWSHAARQGEQNAPVSDDQLRHEGHFDEDGSAGRQVADTDGEHVLRRAEWSQQGAEDGPDLSGARLAGDNGSR